MNVATPYSVEKLALDSSRSAAIGSIAKLNMLAWLGLFTAVITVLMHTITTP